jgi:hypothetical protein
MSESNEIKALNTYYETANSEYDRIIAYFDQLDSKVGFLIATVVGFPIATIGFIAQLTPGSVNLTAIILGCIGILAFLGAGWNILKALWARNVKLGINYEEFDEYSRKFGDNDMKEWVADVLMQSAQTNYKIAMRKAKYLQRVLPFLIIEVLFLLSAITVVLIGRL